MVEYSGFLGFFKSIAHNSIFCSCASNNLQDSQLSGLGAIVREFAAVNFGGAVLKNFDTFAKYLCLVVSLAFCLIKQHLCLCVNVLNEIILTPILAH